MYSTGVFLKNYDYFYYYFFSLFSTWVARKNKNKIKKRRSFSIDVTAFGIILSRNAFMRVVLVLSLLTTDCNRLKFATDQVYQVFHPLSRHSRSSWAVYSKRKIFTLSFVFFTNSFYTALSHIYVNNSLKIFKSDLKLA